MFTLFLAWLYAEMTPFSGWKPKWSRRDTRIVSLGQKLAETNETLEKIEKFQQKNVFSSKNFRALEKIDNNSVKLCKHIRSLLGHSMKVSNTITSVFIAKNWFFKENSWKFEYRFLTKNYEKRNFVCSRYPIALKLFATCSPVKIL